MKINPFGQQSITKKTSKEKCEEIFRKMQEMGIPQKRKRNEKLSDEEEKMRQEFLEMYARFNNEKKELKLKPKIETKTKIEPEPEPEQKKKEEQISMPENQTEKPQKGNSLEKLTKRYHETLVKIKARNILEKLKELGDVKKLSAADRLVLNNWKNLKTAMDSAKNPEEAIE